MLAAGEGRRLGMLTGTRPKPMIEVGGRPVLEHNVRLLAAHQIRDVAINLHHRPDAIVAHFGDGGSLGVRITYAVEPDLLGTAGAVKNLAAFVTDTTIVIYGDNLTTCDLTSLVEHHRSRGAAMTMALFPRQDVAQSGVAEVDDRDRIVRFIEKPVPGTTASTWVNAGILAIEPALLDVIPAAGPSDFGRDIVPALIARGEMVCAYRLRPDERLSWIDTPADLARATATWGAGEVELA